MAEPLKNSFGPDIPERIGKAVFDAFPGFDGKRFLRLALAGFADLELTARARQISDALAETLPEDREAAMAILVSSLGPEDDARELVGMESFFFLPHVFFVADHGLERFEASMVAQYELTKRFTAEFSIRAFIERYPDRTMERLRSWTKDENARVRRLVSEGTRSRLPWAPRLRAFQEDPRPVIELLELLKDDPEELVRRSVANNLNDISKDNQDLAVEVAGRWWDGATENRKRLVRHGLRTLVKKGHPGALSLLGFRADSPARVSEVVCDPLTARIGGQVRIAVEVRNPSDEETGALVDFRVHFVKARGTASPKVFKGAEKILQPGGKARVRKTITLVQQSTRTLYPGAHRIDVMLNGVPHAEASFELLEGESNP